MSLGCCNLPGFGVGLRAKNLNASAKPLAAKRGATVIDAEHDYSSDAPDDQMRDGDSLDEDDESLPDLGDCQDGHVFVCHGDDEPTEFIAWLDDLVSDFRSLRQTVQDVDVALALSESGSETVDSVMDFCERIGVIFRSNFWEGSMVSGNYRLGWMQEDAVQLASWRAKKLLHTLERRALYALRDVVFEELKAIRSLDDFVELTAYIRASRK